MPIVVDGETVFARWLDDHNIRYERDHKVDGGDIDFFVEHERWRVYCDVKEIRTSRPLAELGINADDHIRSDIRKLRAKFKSRPMLPVVLVCMNFSAKVFTGLTVARAMLGEVGIEYGEDFVVTKPTHHLPRGDASMTMKHNRSISGVLVWTELGQRPILFTNPFADHPIDEALFPDTDVVRLDRSGSAKGIHELSNRIFWPLE